MNISEEYWRKLLARIAKAEKNIERLQLLIDRESPSRPRKTSKQMDEEIKKRLIELGN